ncbi:MAG: hypothetical protein U5K75_08620, partial [Ahrensia sp.]|nr:hypothetical protein [Ahrensia sp.]
DEAHADGLDEDWLDAGASRRRLLEREFSANKQRDGDVDELEALRKGQRGRGRGRPAGARNKKSRDFDVWYRAQGFLDPMEASARWLSLNPLDLQAWFIENERAQKAVGKQTVLAVPSLMEIIKEQLGEAERIRPYLYGKKPIQVQIMDERLPALIVNLGTNQLEQGAQIEHRKVLSVGSPLGHGAVQNVNKNNDLGDDE